jgi:hypothetical protein
LRRLDSNEKMLDANFIFIQPEPQPQGSLTLRAVAITKNLKIVELDDRFPWFFFSILVPVPYRELKVTVLSTGTVQN